MFKRSTSVTVMLMLLTGCSGSKLLEASKRKTAGTHYVDSGWSKTIRQNVYEVVVPKIEDKNIVYEKALPLEKLSYKERTDQYISIGTAFSVEENKFISAAHVISPQAKSINKPYYIRDIEGNVYKIKEVLRYSLSHDLIEFSLEEPSKFSTTLPMAELPGIGEGVYTIGNAQGEGISIRGGEIATYTPEPEDGRWHYIRFSAPASPGNSGGPLLNAKGEVIGVVTMKNQSENLNYAIPVSELFKLPTDKALFQKKNLPLSLFGKTTNNSVDFTVPLPAEFEKISQDSEKAMVETFQKFYAHFFQVNEKYIFPLAQRSHHYLRNQYYSMQPTSLQADGIGIWGAQRLNYNKVNIGQDRDLYVNYGQTSANFVVPRPQDVSLTDFLSNPHVILNQIFSGIAVHRPIGDEKVRILSYGKPEAIHLVADAVGRPWTISLWRHHYSMKTTALSCTAVPVGAACSMMEFQTAYESSGVIENIQRFAFLDILSYSGNFQQWQEFLALDDHFLPQVFHKSSFEFVQGQRLEYDFGNMMASFDPRHEFDKHSVLSVKVGFSVTFPLKQEIHGVSISPRSDKVTQYIAGVNFKPSEDMNIESKKRWEDILNRSRPFDGKVFINKDSRMVLVPKAPQTRDVAQDQQEIERAYVGACTGEMASHEKELKDACDRFMKGLKFIK